MNVRKGQRNIRISRRQKFRSTETTPQLKICSKLTSMQVIGHVHF